MPPEPIQILLVEDQSSHVKLVDRAFAEAGAAFRLTIAGTLKDARNQIKAFSPDVVIADLLLPDGRGTELIPEDQESARFPVIVLTSHGNEQVAVDALKAGALDYVVKSASVLQDMPRIAAAALREWQHIVQRKHAEAAREQSLNLVAGVLDSLSTQVAVLDKNGVILMLNAAWRQDLENNPVSRVQITIGDNYLEAGRSMKGSESETTQKIADGIRKVIDGSEPQFSLEFSSQRLEGERWFQLSVIPFSGAGDACVVVLYEDVTERKRTEGEVREQAVCKTQLASLTDREREVMDLVVDGKANKVIAHSIDRSEKTVEKHRANVMRKLKVRTVADLVRLAIIAKR